MGKIFPQIIKGGSLLGVEPRTSHVISQHSATDPHPHPSISSLWTILYVCLSLARLLPCNLSELPHILINILSQDSTTRASYCPSWWNALALQPGVLVKSDLRTCEASFRDLFKDLLWTSIQNNSSLLHKSQETAYRRDDQGAEGLKKMSESV